MRERNNNNEDLVPDDGHHEVHQHVSLPLESRIGALSPVVRRTHGQSYNFPGNTYFASVGSGMNQYGVSPYAEIPVGSAAPNGMFQVFGTAIGIQSVTDGTSNTIAMGEWITGSNTDHLDHPAGRRL